MSKELSFVVGTIVIFLVAAFLTAPQSILRWFTENLSVTVIAVLILLWWVASHKPITGNPVTQLISVFGGLLALAVLFGGFITLRVQAEEYAKARMCSSDTTFGRFVREYVCQPFGLTTPAQPNAQYDLICLTDAFNDNRLSLPTLGCGQYTPDVANDAALYKAYEDCLARSIIEGLKDDKDRGTQLVQSCLVK